MVWNCPAGNLICLLASQIDSNRSLLVLAPLRPPRCPGHRKRSKLSTGTDPALAPQAGSASRAGDRRGSKRRSGCSQPWVGPGACKAAIPGSGGGEREAPGGQPRRAPHRTWPRSVRAALSLRIVPRAGEAWARPALPRSPAARAAPRVNPRGPGPHAAVSPAGRGPTAGSGRASTAAQPQEIGRAHV